MGRLLSVVEVAKILGITREAVIKRIHSGTLAAQKVGNSFIIDEDSLVQPHSKELSENQKNIIEHGVEKTLQDYEEALRLLKDA